MMPMGVEMVDPKTGKRFGLETSAICVLDIKSGGETLFSVKEALENDTLDLVLAHENAHGIQFDLYGKLFHKIQRTSTNGHDAPYITDLGMAYIEGWAEAFEAVYGPSNPKLKEKDRKKIQYFRIPLWPPGPNTPRQICLGKSRWQKNRNHEEWPSADVHRRRCSWLVL